MNRHSAIFALSALFCACKGSKDATPASASAASTTARAASATPSVAPATALAAPRTPSAIACDGTGNSPHGCDFLEQICVAGTCRACPSGFVPMLTECQKRCSDDGECGAGQICSFTGGKDRDGVDLSLCGPRPPKQACPKGQILLKTGSCFTPCETDADCGAGLCCKSDPNAPEKICMSSCW